jgi:opacity protein-like surface antigen
VNHFKRSNIYVGGGLGAYYEMLDGEVETDFQGSFKFDDQDTVLGFHMLVGFLYNLSQNIYLGLEWSPLLLDEAKFKSNNSDKKATLEEVDLDGELLSAVFGIRF